MTCKINFTVNTQKYRKYFKPVKPGLLIDWLNFCKMGMLNRLNYKGGKQGKSEGTAKGYL